MLETLGMDHWTWFDWLENILFYTALYFLLWNAYFLTINKGIPNIKTAPAIRKKIIELLKQDMELKQKKTYTIIDLGSGNGDFSRQIAEKIPNAHVIGIEISKIAYVRSCLMKRIKGLKNLSYINKDFKKADLSQADAITMFLLGTLMKSIRETLEAGLSDNTLVTSNKFPVGGTWQPEQVLEIDTLMPHQKKLFIYRYAKKHDHTIK